LHIDVLRSIFLLISYCNIAINISIDKNLTQTHSKMKNLSEKQSAEVPVITGGLAMGRGVLGAFVLRGGAIIRELQSIPKIPERPSVHKHRGEKGALWISKHSNMRWQRQRRFST